VWLCAPAVEVA